ncbi:MAG: alpha/beta fold hydrolase, partial [Pseudomonadales bacterium]
MMRLVAGLIFCTLAVNPLGQECVVLLHGLARTSNSMNRLEAALEQSGYDVINFDYPSRHRAVEELARTVIPEVIKRCEDKQTRSINFVTHSLGGILVRYYFERHDPAQVDRVVMLGPPNKGSEVVDNLEDMPGFELLNGPAGMQLGTGEDDIPAGLGPVNFELGVIAGTRSINLI